MIAKTMWNKRLPACAEDCPSTAVHATNTKMNTWELRLQSYFQWQQPERNLISPNHPLRLERPLEVGPLGTGCPEPCPGLNHLQRWRLHSLPGQPVPGLGYSMGKKCLLMFTANLLSSSLCPWPLVLPLGTTGRSTLCIHHWGPLEPSLLLADERVLVPGVVSPQGQDLPWWNLMSFLLAHVSSLSRFLWMDAQPPGLSATPLPVWCHLQTCGG